MSLVVIVGGPSSALVINSQKTERNTGTRKWVDDGFGLLRRKMIIYNCIGCIFHGLEKQAIKKQGLNDGFNCMSYIHKHSLQWNS